MSDINPINNVNPAYPVKPVQPSRKDRQSDPQQRERPDPENESGGDDNSETVIDEYV